MGHRNICCDGCQRENFSGRRFRCLRCANYDLCGDCYDQQVETLYHRIDHPMQLILDQDDREHDLLQNGEVPELVHLPNCFTCPYCGQFGHTAKRFIEHVCGQHRLADGHVVCPMCAGLPGIELIAIRNLSRHLLLNHIDHANLLEPDTPPLRRIIARNRIRRRRQLQQQQQQSPQQQQQQPQQAQSRRSGVILQLSTGPWLADPQLASNIEPTEEVANNDTPTLSVTVVESPTEQPQQYLLLEWIAQQELRCQDPELVSSQRRRHALFAEHLMVSMLCCEELLLPQDRETGSGSRRELDWDRDREQECHRGLSKVMSVMSLPWTRAWQATQMNGSEGEVQLLDTPKYGFDLNDGRGQLAEERKAKSEEAID
ncbi:E3 ubiquitin-protein ligase KCMF1 [Drosophila eugracilis]|uniref:E3 ubiquitin-protein ligase KCMF1 n=1 Tax=Drosophila eugracilis TaxID=29029 RepID=UPI001BDB0694|nr:E3 ubiquitin-protein ligase KCMF1 [Drosophila eugracilis]